MSAFRRCLCAFGRHKMKPKEWRRSPYTVHNWSRDWSCDCGLKTGWERGYVNHLTHDSNMPPPSRHLTDGAAK